MKRNELESILDGSMEPRDLRFSLLERITDDFSEDRKIGEGGFASVYKGILQNGEVAVKRITNNMTIDETLFHREVNSLTQVSHQNIVRFLGFCSNTTHKQMKHKGRYIYAENRERLLCFEYISNGSLDNYITDELRGLEWNTRYNIIKGICKGLEYLHMDRHIVHMDLKPANILLDNDMMPKITDFGLSRMDEYSRTISANRFISPGYCAPEYLEDGKISVKSDVYSLGAIIIELVAGRRDISDKKNVLRRWGHRWNKAGQEIQFGNKQIAKLMEIGMLCKESDPYRRPFISEIIHDIDELESIDTQVISDNEYIFGQEDGMLGIDPLELHFPFEINKQTSCSLQLTNDTNACTIFSIQTTSPLPYRIEPTKGIVGPRSKYTVNITLQPIEKAPQDKRHTGDFIVRSTKLNESLSFDSINEDMFKEYQGKMVDEVNLTVSHKPSEPQSDPPLELLTISGTGNLNSLEASNVPEESESKTSLLCTSNQLIQFDPPELRFPFLTNKRVPMLCSIKITNVTSHYVGFNSWTYKRNSASYHMTPDPGILAPGSTQVLKIKRIAKENQSEDMQCKDDMFSLWNGIVNEGIEANDLVSYTDDEESKQLPIVFTKTSLLFTSHELIQFDPPELRFPFLTNKMVPMLSSVKITNVTNHYVGFNSWTYKSNSASYHMTPDPGILAPGSTQVLKIKRIAMQNQSEDMQCKEDTLGLWNGIVNETMEASDLVSYLTEEESKKLPIVFTKTSLLIASDELIQFDPPEIRFPFMTNKRVPMLSSIKIINVTNHYVGFNSWTYKRNSASYHMTPDPGILAPGSTQVLRIKRIAKENQSEDMQCKDDMLGLWNGIVNEAMEPMDLVSYQNEKESKLVPIIFTKTDICTSDELIQFDPPELHFPSLPKKMVPMISSIKIVNVTDHYVGFNTWSYESNSAWYITVPTRGILPPRSTKELKVKRVGKENESDDMQCKDIFGVWNGIVNEGFEAKDLVGNMEVKESKNLPIVFTKTSLCTSDDLIHFDPPELRFPFLTNKRVPMLCSVKIVNVTNHYVGFNSWTYKSNSASYHMTPDPGILPPRSTQVLKIKRVATENESEDMQHKEDMFGVWNGILNEGIKASDLSSYMDNDESKLLPIVFSKTDICTPDELIHFDPPELRFPSLPNKRVPMVCSIKIVNVTDHYVGFITWSYESNSAWYITVPTKGILPPRSTKELKVKRIGKENESEDMQCKDIFGVWNGIVNEGFEAKDLTGNMEDKESKHLPIVFTKTSLCTSDELIQFDPPELRFPFLPNKRVPMLCLIKIVNVTNHFVGFNSWTYKSNSASYSMTPDPGILPPNSTQVLKIKRVAMENESEDMQGKNDMFGVWNGIVNEDIKASDLTSYMDTEASKLLPVVFTKPGESSSP